MFQYNIIAENEKYIVSEYSPEYAQNQFFIFPSQSFTAFYRQIIITIFSPNRIVY